MPHEMPGPLPDGPNVEPGAKFSKILKDTAKAALEGGLPGAMAMGIQVCSLMWLRTTMNYQYRYGTSTKEAMKTLYAQGGLRRFYRGLLPALLQGPLSRFGDTAANTGALYLMDQSESTRDLPTAAKTVVASVSAGTFRIFLMPIDAIKTTLQVEGKNGTKVLLEKMKVNGFRVLYHGALASSAGTVLGHFPWFFTYNTLNQWLPQQSELHWKLLRNAGIGFTASAISDTISNSMRVIKTTKQTSTVAISYGQAVRSVVDAEGVMGLLGRGLKTRLLTNGMQGLMFTVLWKLLEEQLYPERAAQRAAHGLHVEVKTPTPKSSASDESPK